MNMPVSSSIVPVFAVLGFGVWELVVMLAVSLLLFGSTRLPELWRGLCKGIEEFKRATLEITDKAAFAAGRSAGGIYGKAAAEALTPHNHVAELYDPAVFRKCDREKGKDFLFRLKTVFRSWINFLFKIFHQSQKRS